MKATARATPAPDTAVAMPGRFDEMKRIIAGLETWTVESEAAYLAVGREIQTLFRQVSTIRDDIDRSTAVLASEAMTDMRLRLAGAVEDTEALSTLGAERGAALARLSAAVRQGASGSAAVLQVFRLLDYLVLIARATVEGKAEGQHELGPFTAHVKQLVEVGTRVSRDVDACTQWLGRCLDESRTIGRRNAGAGTGMIDNFLTLIAGLEAQQRASAERRDKARAAFAEIWNAIGEVVTGLQCHDMARQRLEHSIANLSRMADLERTGILRDGVPPVAAELRPAVLLRIAALEIAQINDLAAVYAAKMEALATNLDAIGAAIDRSRVILGQLAARGDGGSVSLQGEAAQLRLHFQDGKAARGSLKTSLDQCVETTVSLITMTGKLDELEHELRIAGLNAAVRAAHVKSGDDTIGYIARVICEQALTARGEADAVRRGIALAAAETRDLSHRILPATQAAEARIEALLVDSCATFAAAEADYADAIGAADRTAEGLPGDVRSIRTMMTPHILGCALMRSLSDALTTFAATLDPTVIPPDDIGDIDALLAGQYTMAEEREVFARVVGIPPTVAAPPTEAGSTDRVDDILF